MARPAVVVRCLVRHGVYWREGLRRLSDLSAESQVECDGNFSDRKECERLQCCSVVGNGEQEA